MNPALAETIERFRASQDRAVLAIQDLLGPTLGVRLPSSGQDWIEICDECGLHDIRSVCGIPIYSHGYGIEFKFPEMTVDFDFGRNGETDGFDAWRLWNFISLNQIDVQCQS